MAKERLDKIISHCCYVTRSQAKQLVKQGLVTINGSRAHKADEKIDRETDILKVRGESVNISEHVYIMMHKPAGVLSASRDSRAKTVLDLLPPKYLHTGLFPAGRLDKDTTGLLIITNDGDLAHRMLSPKSHIPKTYIAKLDKPLSKKAIDSFGKGMYLDNGEWCKPGLCEPLDDELTVKVVISEGKYHQIKRMFAACGFKVLALKRIKMGALFLDDELLPGACRYLLKDEVARLTKI